jgi:hypothetical protein
LDVNIEFDNFMWPSGVVLGMFNARSIASKVAIASAQWGSTRTMKAVVFVLAVVSMVYRRKTNYYSPGSNATVGCKTTIYRVLHRIDARLLMVAILDHDKKWPVYQNQ